MPSSMRQTSALLLLVDVDAPNLVDELGLWVAFGLCSLVVFVFVLLTVAFAFVFVLFV